jgi:uncharacterized FAD-dependent dehydrogenase
MKNDESIPMRPRPMGKGELSTVIASFRAQCEKLGVDIRMNSEVTEDTIKEFNPDAIIVATGSRPMMPPYRASPVASRLKTASSPIPKAAT